MLVVWPLATIVHVSRCSALVNSFGTVTVNMPHWRPGRKCVGCPMVGPARLDAVVGADGNVDLLGAVAIEIADEERAAAVGVLEPAFERARDAGAELPARLARQLLRRRQSAHVPTRALSTHTSRRRTLRMRD